MIEKNDIQKVVENSLNEPPLVDKRAFLVSLTISTDNTIYVTIDAYQGISVEDCIAVNKAVKAEFDQDFENYALTVSSAGLTEPFKVSEQYRKAIGKEIKIQTTGGKRYKGELIEYGKEKLTLAVKSKKKKQIINEIIKLEEIKSAKQIISF